MVLAYLESRYTQLHAAGWTADFYVHFAIDPTKEQHQIVCKFRKKCNEWLDKRLGKGEWAVHGPSKLSETGRRDSWRAKLRACSSFSSTLKELFTKKIVLASQTINSKCYCNVLWRLLENVWKLLRELWLQDNLLLHHNNATCHTPFSTRDFFLLKNKTVVPHPPYIYLFPRLKTTENSPFSHKWGDWGRIACGTEHPRRTPLPGSS
jgi:hypothetical protein